MDAVPIVGLFAGEDLAGPLAGDFLAVDVVQPRPSQPEARRASTPSLTSIRPI